MQCFVRLSQRTVLIGIFSNDDGDGADDPL